MIKLISKMQKRHQKYLKLNDAEHAKMLSNCHTRCRISSSQTNCRKKASNMGSYMTSKTDLFLFASICLTIILSCFAIFNVQATPPIDFFRYTSSDGVLEPLESLYKFKIPHSNSQNNSNEQLSDKLLQLMQNTTHEHNNNQVVDLNLVKLAWHLMEKQALLYMQNRVAELRPFVQKLLIEANTTQACQSSISGWFDHLAKLDLWASLMWNSWGDFPPSGLFEGSFTDLGSYPSCMQIEPNEIIGEPQYCMLDFQPLVPTRPRFHSILKQVLGVNPTSGLITRADFQTEPNLNAQHSAHEFSSSRFAKWQQNTQDNTQIVANSSQPNRYSKRTIETTFPTKQLSNNIDFDSSNLTIKADALIELANRAQYFYYVKFRLGSCFPSKCSNLDIQKIAQAAGERAILQAGQVNCLKKEPFKLNGYQLLAIFILSSLTLVAFLGTILDLLGFKAKDNGNELQVLSNNGNENGFDIRNNDSNSNYAFVDWLLLFSVWTNGKKLFDVYTNGHHADLEVIHGLRFFSMVWVIYGHTILYTEYQAFTHFFEVIETKITNLFLLPSLNANFSVDTFFVISGVLTTYVTWEFMRGDTRKFNRMAFAVSRYIRLTPQLIIVILLFFLLPLTGEGPLFKQVTEYQADLCYKGWLTNLLYLQSYTDSEKICIDPSWWLSIEMSFHLISILIISVMVHNPRNGLILNFVIAFGLTIWGAIIHYTNGFAIQYLPSIPQRYEVQSEQTKMFFHKPYPHAPSYFIGIALGYLLATRTIKRLTKMQQIQGWLLCSTGLIVCLWGNYYWNLGAPYTQLQATIYYHACQILWPLSIAWIIFICSLGQGGLIHSILAAPIFAPLGRITYMTYLSHALIIFYYSACRNIPVEPSIMAFIYSAMSNTLLALLLGVILTLVFESPVLNLQKQLITFLSSKFEPVKSKPNRTSKSQQEVNIANVNENEECQQLNQIISHNGNNKKEFEDKTRLTNGKNDTNQLN